MNRLYRGSTTAFGLLFVALGIALLVRTADAGGGTSGYLFGVLFVLLGVGRLYLLRRG